MEVANVTLSSGLCHAHYAPNYVTNRYVPTTAYTKTFLYDDYEYEVMMSTELLHCCHEQMKNRVDTYVNTTGWFKPFEDRAVILQRLDCHHALRVPVLGPAETSSETTLRCDEGGAD